MTRIGGRVRRMMKGEHHGDSSPSVRTLSLDVRPALSASAQNSRSLVSVTGNGANPCTPGFERRTFTRALAVTNAGGEIVAITSGGYGAVTINKAVSIIAAPGIVGSLQALGSEM